MIRVGLRTGSGYDFGPVVLPTYYAYLQFHIGNVHPGGAGRAVARLVRQRAVKRSR